ncbi:hypothetical protein NQZ68_026737 [Dissostichus eleginoides]|nr:hypothetical protein NQZ68_026737 [Dissostichus eleginoides]
MRISPFSCRSFTVDLKLPETAKESANLCVFKLAITGNDSRGGDKSDAESSAAEVEVKVTTVPCFRLASYRVMFHPSEKRTLKHLPLSLIRDSFPFGFQGKGEVR